jgi:hypothetical protein
MVSIEKGARKPMPLQLFQLRAELKNRVLARTGRQIRNLDIELLHGGVIIRGEAMSFYVKQLAQQGVREYLPDVRLDNAIQVAS